MSPAFAPIPSLIGGALIGVAATALLLFNGRVAGVAGILGSIAGATPGDRAWRLAFVLGLISAGLVALQVLPASFDATPIRPVAATAVAGVLVGFGARLGSGCTSGHGVCGMARLSKRSIVATLVFMATAAITVLATRAWLGAGS